MKPQIYFQNLDALRAIAALAVIFAHMSFRLQFPETDFYLFLENLFSIGGNGAILGVTFFFVLSGFLITHLLLNEYKLTGKIAVLNFYMRRLLRIWPLYFLSVFVGFILLPFLAELAGHPINERANGWMYLFFLANFDHIYNAFPIIGVLGVQWSVCVEEQFYLIWPLLFLIVIRFRFFIPAIILIILISQVLFVTNFESIDGGRYHLVSCFRFLALGGLMAVLVSRFPDYFIGALNRLPVWVMRLVYFTGFLYIIFMPDLMENFESLKIYQELLPAIFFAFIIFEQNFYEKSFVKFGTFKWLTWLGKISYGLYLNHMIAIYIVMYAVPADVQWIPVKIGLTLTLTVAISYLTYHYFEIYFLKLKGRFSA